MPGNEVDRTAFERWLSAYGGAWEDKDAEGFAALFVQDARYYWTPFQPPKLGRAGIAEAFSDATSRQRDIRFGYEVLHCHGDEGGARWWCAFTRAATAQAVRLDGILKVTMSAEGLCEEFREWWHSDEVSD